MALFEKLLITKESHFLSVQFLIMSYKCKIIFVRSYTVNFTPARLNFVISRHKIQIHWKNLISCYYSRVCAFSSCFTNNFIFYCCTLRHVAWRAQNSKIVSPGLYNVFRTLAIGACYWKTNCVWHFDTRKSARISHDKHRYRCLLLAGFKPDTDLAFRDCDARGW